MQHHQCYGSHQFGIGIHAKNGVLSQRCFALDIHEAKCLVINQVRAFEDRRRATGKKILVNVELHALMHLQKSHNLNRLRSWASFRLLGHGLPLDGEFFQQLIKAFDTIGDIADADAFIVTGTPVASRCVKNKG